MIVRLRRKCHADTVNSRRASANLTARDPADPTRSTAGLAQAIRLPGRTLVAAVAVVMGMTTAAAQSAACSQATTPISTIQGSGDEAAVTGDVSVRGVVVGDFEGRNPNLRGFYLQDPVGDGDPATSDAIFVFNGNADDVRLGDVVVVAGEAEEFQDQTQIDAERITRCGTGVVAPVDVLLPLPYEGYLERFEGMLVRFPQELFVTEMYQLGRFGQLTLSSGGRLPQPTAVALPGDDAWAAQARNDLNRIVLDDHLNDQNPDPIPFGPDGGPLTTAAASLRGGDTVTGLTGVLTHTWSGNGASGTTYRLRPLGALSGGRPRFTASNPRPAVPDVGGDVKVASLNVLNYFTTLRSRGAADPDELRRQRDKLVAALVGLDADVVGLTELENDPRALADLLAALNEELGVSRYAAVEAGRVGGDEIAVGLLYDRTTLSPVGSHAVLDDRFDRDFRDHHNRAALAQTFETAGGERFTVVVNHLKSKGSPCADVGDLDRHDLQGNCNLTRLAAVEVLIDWLAQDPTAADDPDYLLVGDFNAYPLEDPIRRLSGAGFVDLQARYAEDYAYTFAFDGHWGRLDYAFATPSLAAQVTGAAAWHINADEVSVLDYQTDFKSYAQLRDLYEPSPYRSSDHDPLLIGFDLR